MLMVLEKDQDLLAVERAGTYRGRYFVLGGVLTLVFGAWHIARRRKDRLAIPYGVAIASAGLWVLTAHYLPPVSAASGVLG